MRHRAILLWLVLISFVLTPLSTLHVHTATADHDSAVHGGHLHDFDVGEADDHGADVEPIGDVQLIATGRSGDLRWTEWLPVLLALGVAWLSLPYLTSILRPPSIDDSSTSRRRCWKPPLRGPPLISIPAR